MTDRYAVIGNPVAHSKSPRIHAHFALLTGEDIDYAALLAPLDGFAQTVRQFAAAGGRGLNVTVPFKNEAFQLADRLTPRAEAAQAVNTLVFTDTGILGDNTDGAGLVRDIAHNAGFALAGRRILLLGAGGAAAGVVGPLLAAGCAALAIANRTAEKAALLAARWPGAPVQGMPLDGIGGAAFDLVINATSGSLRGETVALPAAAMAPGCLVYDMMYGDAPTPFLLAAAQNGAAHIRDGLGMLVEQAAESFLVWRGVRPPTVPVMAALRQKA